jgi:hypothetical protein
MLAPGARIGDSLYRDYLSILDLVVCAEEGCHSLSDELAQVAHVTVIHNHFPYVVFPSLLPYHADEPYLLIASSENTLATPPAKHFQTLQ